MSQRQTFERIKRSLAGSRCSLCTLGSLYFITLKKSTLITSAMELPADLLSIVGITWLGRRWSASLSLLLCGLTMMVCAFVKGRKMKSFHLFHLRLEFIVLQITAFLIGRIFANYAMNVGLQYTVEVMPTCLRGQGTALVNVMSMLSQMASPYIVYSVRDTL